MKRSEYPRPQLERHSWLNLNGEWDFDFDDDDRGQLDHWESGTNKFGYKINVPFAYQTELSGIFRLEPHDIVWYQRHFSINKNPQRVYQLHFGAVDYQADVFLNGQLVAHHEGGETCFSANVTSVLKDKDNLLVVRVVDPRKDETILRGKQSWESEPTAIWYTGTTGIWQTVWLEDTGQTYIESLNFTPRFDAGQVAVNAKLNRFQKQLKLSYTICFKDELIVSGEFYPTTSQIDFSVDLIHNQIFRTNYHRAGYSWSPEDPNLFDVEVKLIFDDQEIDRVSSYFGMRKISQKNGMIYLNNRPYYQKLVLDQGYWEQGLLTAPSDHDFIQDIELAKKMGFNGCRLHQKVEDPRFLYWADRLGFLVWGECSSAPIYHDLSVQRLMKEWGDIIDRDYNHPCIVAWVPLNESWGVPNIQFDRQQQHFSQALYHYIHSLDTTRLVVSNDGWSQTETDICTIHNYAHGRVDEPEQQRAYEQQLHDREHLLASSPAGKQVYADDFHWNGVPIMLTEFGGISYQTNKDKDWGYTEVADDQQYLQEYERLIRSIYQSKAIWGFCYTQLFDVEQETNGLLRYNRLPKVPVEKIKAINSLYHDAYIENSIDK
ncbi:glycoside hydrolase family 2 protein [Lapidilactobacillus luobeiensis]|uniref:glycoside hydrolase family 2 protein n=1 Tax=Lapidilactobacillus luobeiensis TaxID=2950371 RepID=UPI0021C3AB05|nr:sugar-binding domain-containing protein [Lapidilactobacillus luobeiensis]